MITRDEAVVALAHRKGLRIADGAAPIPDLASSSIPALVDGVSKFGAVDALVGADGRLTYAEVGEAVARAAGALRELGVRAGDRVSVSLPNSIEIVIAFLAAQRLGAIWVGLNQALAPPEKAYVLRHAEASLLIADAATLASVAPHRGELDALAATVEASGNGTATAWSERVADAAPLDPSWPSPDPHLPAGIAYTSGTTGFPKGVVHSQHNMLVPPAVQRHRSPRPVGFRAGHALPLTILNIIIVGPLTTMVSGQTFVAIDRNSARGVVDWCRREGLGSFLVAPPTVHDLVSAPDITPADLATVERPGAGGAGVTEELRQAFIDKFGRRFSVGYGMTEAPTSVSYEREDQPSVPGASGEPAPQVCITVRDESGHVLGPGEDGEICIAGADSGAWAGVYTPMLGYWAQPEQTAEALAGGYYRSGDIGHLDDGGRVHIRARRSEMILRGGANIYPAEVERVVTGHPGVRSCVVVGRPHERLGEELVAVVEREGGETVDVDALRQRCLGELSRYKVPAEFVVVDVLPRNQMDKVVRPRVRREILGIA